MVNKKRIVETFLDMVKISSPSLHEREMADYLKKKLIKIGLEVVEDSAGRSYGGNAGNVIGVLKAPGKKKILFSSHMDTVTPCDTVLPIVENNIIKSDGTSVLGGDDKAGIAAILEMLYQIKERNCEHPEIIVVFSIAEEIGLKGVKALDISQYNPDYGVIIDSNGGVGTVVIQSPYAVRGEIEIIGKAAHAGVEPEKGINALTVAAHAITKLKLGRVDEKTTSNIGVISGGSAVNIVMPTVSMKYEARSYSKKILEELLIETKRIFSDTADRFGAEFKENIEKTYDGFEISDDTPILEIVKKACKDINVRYNPVKSGGGSDTNIYNQKGVSSINLGIGMTKVHTKNEYIKIEDIVRCSELLISILDRV